MKDFIKNELKKELNFIIESSIIRIENISPDADKITDNLLLPYVKDLFIGINKIKRGHGNTLTPSEKDKIKTIFSKIFRQKSTKNIEIKFEDSIVPHDFNDIYDVKRADGKLVKVSIGFFYDKKSNSNMKTNSIDLISLNINSFNLYYINRLRSLIRHELIHIYDPKSYDTDIQNKILGKYKNDPFSYPTYYKLLHEFDTWSHEIITTIEDNLKNIVDDNYRDYLILKLWQLISDINTEDISTTYNEFKDNPVIKLFAHNGIKLKDKRLLQKSFEHFLHPIQAWKTKPTLFKMFQKRLARVVPYKTF